MRIQKSAPLLFWLVLASACQRPPPAIDWSLNGNPPERFDYPADARVPCWLKLNRAHRPVIRVNCFASEGILYTHSNRLVPLANLVGESWTMNVETYGSIRVALEGKVYEVVAERVQAEDRRVRMLKDRGYGYVPDAIQVYALLTRDR